MSDSQELRELMSFMPSLQDLMSDSDVRRIVNARLDQVSTPMNDNSPVDFAAMIQDIDQLDEILTGMQYANHTDNHDNTTADSDVRHMSDAQLDRESTPAGDNNPLDYAEMM